MFQRLTWRRGTVTSARFAPDGQTVLYSAAWDGKLPAIYIKRPESPDAVPLDLPSADLLAISSSGEKVPGLVHDAHPTPAELLEDVVAGDYLSNHWAG